MKVYMIACASPELGIGANNKLLGHVKEDMDFFIVKTKGKPLLMGSNTARSLPNALPLKNRANYVLCRKNESEWFEERGFIPLVSVNPIECLNCIPEEEVMIIGGGYIYSEFIHVADVIYLNIYSGYSVTPDVFFPEIDESWSLTSHRSKTTAGLEYREYRRIK